MKLQDLTILSQKNPIGIDRKPYFSYVLTSDRKNTYQSEYSICVRAGNEIVWKSEKKTTQSTFIPYEGPMRSRTRYDVTVTVRDNHNEENVICGFFETALLEKNAWVAQWVRSALPVFPAEKGFGKQPPATMFRKTFEAEKKVSSARLYATCHGIYAPYLNENRIGNSAFSPEHTTYEKVLCYQTYDVTGMIRSGENTLSLYVGDGWYLGVKTTPRVRNYERRHAVLFQLEITWDDGTRSMICSDENVECAYGPVVASDLFAGEKYDANLHFCQWQLAEVANYGLDSLCAQHGPGVTFREEIPVEQILHTPAGELVLDFGKVLAGRVRMKVTAPKGTAITLTHSEVLDQQGNFFQNTEMPDGGVEQMVQYISNGEQRYYEPLFTYQGFRYVKVEGLTNVDPKDFAARIYSSDGENAGTFCCSDEKLNALYRNIRNAQRSNMFSIPTDCPQREKAGWTGDIAIYARTALLNANITPLLERWLLSVRADQGENGAVPIVVPYDGGYPMSEQLFGPMYEVTGTIGSSGWGDACILVPWAMYQITGNTAVIRDNLDVMEKWCAYILEQCKLPGKDKTVPDVLDRWLWNRGYHQGDWLTPSMEGTGGDDPIMASLYQQNYTAQYTAPLYGYNSVRLLAEMLMAVGEYQKAEGYEAVAKNMREAIQTALFAEDGTMPTDLMGAYVLAIAFDVVPEKHRAFVHRRLLKLLEAHDGCLDTGFLSTPFLLDALWKLKEEETAYKLLFQEKCPGWMYQLERGATSIWESWDNYELDGTPKKISFNHYAFGCVDDWISRKICGLESTAPGFRTFRVAPQPDNRITSAKREFLSPYGMIRVCWERKNSGFRMQCTIPCNTKASIVLPGGKTYEVGSGCYEFME